MRTITEGKTHEKELLEARKKSDLREVLPFSFPGHLLKTMPPIRITSCKAAACTKKFRQKRLPLMSQPQRETTEFALNAILPFATPSTFHGVAKHAI
ncbi:hypothetical protein, partial [Duodenibacillus massiliensis]|uniref:hypothetical protein n=1 Tax=Duodenibacillus massiliensis TaxID=1852381 RepID=UPI00307AFDFB